MKKNLQMYIVNLKKFDYLAFLSLALFYQIFKIFVKNRENNIECILNVSDNKAKHKDLSSSRCFQLIALHCFGVVKCIF